MKITIHIILFSTGLSCFGQPVMNQNGSLIFQIRDTKILANSGEVLAELRGEHIFDSHSENLGSISGCEIKTSSSRDIVIDCSGKVYVKGIFSYQIRAGKLYADSGELLLSSSGAKKQMFAVCVFFYVGGGRF